MQPERGVLDSLLPLPTFPPANPIDNIYMYIDNSCLLRRPSNIFILCPELAGCSLLKLVNLVPSCFLYILLRPSPPYK